MVNRGVIFGDIQFARVERRRRAAQDSLNLMGCLMDAAIRSAGIGISYEVTFVKGANDAMYGMMDYAVAKIRGLDMARFGLPDYAIAIWQRLVYAISELFL